MQAKLDEKGTLVIWSESPVEAFALTHWKTLWEKREAILFVQTCERDPEGSGHLNHNLSEVEAQS